MIATKFYVYLFSIYSVKEQRKTQALILKIQREELEKDNEPLSPAINKSTLANEIDTFASESQENSQPFHGWHSNLEEEENDEDGLDDRFLDLQRKIEEKNSQTKNDEEYAKTLEDKPKSPRPSTSVPMNSTNPASKHKLFMTKVFILFP